HRCGFPPDQTALAAKLEHDLSHAQPAQAGEASIAVAVIEQALLVLERGQRDIGAAPRLGNPFARLVYPRPAGRAVVAVEGDLRAAGAEAVEDCHQRMPLSIIKDWH